MSSSEVTITLGRTGQVVKRKRRDSDVARSESLHSATPSLRLGRTVSGNPLSFDSKRLRNNDDRRILSRDGIKDFRLGHKDLRLKLLHKRSAGSVKSHNAGTSGQKRSNIQEDVSAQPRSSINSSMPWSCPELRRNSHAMQLSARDSARDSLYMDSPRSYYSSLTRDDSRVRSPARTLTTSRSFSPPTYQTEFRGLSSMRPNVTSAAQHILRNEVHDPHMPLQLPSMNAQSVMVTRPAAPIPPPNGTLQRSLYLGEASLSVPGLLNSLGLAKYAIHFQAEEVDMTALKQMCEKDLKDIGIPMGPRKKILQAVMAISKRPPPAPPLPPRQL